MSVLYIIADFFAPVVMFIVGILWRISPPPFQSKGLTYSTELTRNNPEAWAAAHLHCSKLWVRISVLSALVSGVLIWLFPDSHSSFWVWIIVGQMVLFCMSVFMVDLLLKTKFGDEK